MAIDSESGITFIKIIRIHIPLIPYEDMKLITPMVILGKEE